MRLTKKTKKAIAIVAAILGTVILLGVFGVINVDKLRERNDDNLITEKSIVLESIDDKDTDVKIDVDENGVVKLRGEASVFCEYVYATVELEPGTYSFTGAEDGTLKTYYMALRVDENDMVRSDGDPITIAEAGEYDIVLVIQEDCKFPLLGAKLYPLLLPADDAEDASFWK